MTIRVLIADDQSMVRAGFRMLLAGEQDMEVVAEASNGLEAVAKAAQFDPTVILMDIRMPELDGLQATRRIIATDNTARILILTTFGLDEYIYEALSAGASGFVLKDDPPEQLIEAVRTVAAGDALLSPAITKRVINQFTRIPRHEPPKELDELTARLVGSNFNRRHWQPALKAASITGFTFHGLRHSAVAYMVAAGAHPKAIQQRLGHSSWSTTMDIYGHVLPADDDTLTAALDGLLQGGEVQTAAHGKLASVRSLIDPPTSDSFGAFLHSAPQA